MAEATVKFNVGGKHFEVSRALVNGHSDTVLGKLVSDIWNEDRGEIVFIDRDGDIFALILNYLRYGSIELPVTLPRSMFDRELDYYGIASDKGVTDQDSLAKITESFVGPIVNAQKKLDMAKADGDLFLLALECYSQFSQKRIKEPNSSSARVLIGIGHTLYKDKSVVDEERKIFDNYLEKHFGLKIKSKAPNTRGSSFTVCIKKDE